MIMNNVILRGDSATGKTVNAQLVAEAYGCSAVCDIGSGDRLDRYTGKRCLIITNSQRVTAALKLGATMVSVAEARAMVGSAWIEAGERACLACKNRCVGDARGMCESCAREFAARSK